MRIAIDVAQTCVEKAGCGYYSDSLARALAATAGVDQLQLLHHFGRWFNTDTSQGTHIDAPHVSTPLAGLGHLEASEMWSRIASGEAHLPGDPDLVHSCSFQAPALADIPLVVTVYDVAFWSHPEFCDEANRLVCQRGILNTIRNASGLLFISEHARSEFDRILGGWLVETKIPNAVVHLAPRKFPADGRVTRELPPRYWLAVGSIEPRKNYEAILDAHECYWNESPDPAPLVIAGSRGWKSAHIHQRLEAADPARVRYLGFVPDNELGALYSGATALIFPSWNEGFGLPVCEAMSQGCPVICSNRASLLEVAGGAALMVDPAEVGAIVRHMRYLDSDESARRAISEAGRRQASLFTWGSTARATVDFYTEVIERFKAHMRSGLVGGIIQPGDR